jgi:hypothetical protein
MLRPMIVAPMLVRGSSSTRVLSFTDDPLVELLPTDVEGVFQALPGAGDEAVEGHRDRETQS